MYSVTFIKLVLLKPMLRMEIVCCEAGQGYLHNSNAFLYIVMLCYVHVYTYA